VKSNMRMSWNKIILPLLIGAPVLFAQMPPQIPAAAQAMLQIQQPTVDNTTPVTAQASFDPPLVRAGERTFYRVDVTATESAIQWPVILPAPEELKVTAHASGQTTQFTGNTFRPHTTFLYEMQPATAGQYVITNFTVSCAGQPVQVPPASLDVVTEAMAAQPPRQLKLQTTATNVFIGQPFRVRVILPAGPGNQLEALHEIQISGAGLMTDQSGTRQSIEVIDDNGSLRPAFICDLMVTPIAAGPMALTAQGFTAGREFSGPISIHGQVSLPGGPAKYVLLISDPIRLNVRPLPAEGELPGFTGAMGIFIKEPPVLSTDRLKVGEPVHLKLTFHGEGDLARFVPPSAPISSDWQVIADPVPATGFTFIPLTDEAQATPAIPFCAFDPISGTYRDLSIPPIPVTVIGEGLPVELRDAEQVGDDSVPVKLSSLAPAPGKSVSRLTPLQLRGWFVGIQLLPVAGFCLLWQWDRHRRFLEAHPDLVRRRKARRDLRRKKMELQKAAAAGDAESFIQLAAAAMRIAVAPHYPANPQALVGGDVLAQLDSASQNGGTADTVKQIFAATDRRFAAQAKAPADWLALNADVEAVLQQLEAKL
jgi:hypothetical protein